MNVWRQGLTYFAGYWGYDPLIMLARLVSNPNIWIGRLTTEQLYAPLFSLPFGGSQLEYSGAIEKLSPHFPYGWEVEPDQP